jgi:hypothetical protein
VSTYLDYLDEKINKQSIDILKKRMVGYKEYIKSIIKINTVLEKRFFFIVPFSPLEMGISGANPGSLNKEYVITRAKTSLYPKRDNLLRLITKIGLKGSILQSQELTELYYNLYNPSATGRRLAPVESYTDVIMTTG